MALYSPGRRRAILLLLLTSALLLTLDMRGSALLDNGRALFTRMLRPLETAAEVATRPIEHAWRGITDYGDLERRYDDLSARYEQMRADHFVARAVLAQNRELKALFDLTTPEHYAVTTAYVIGDRPTNVDHFIQLDKGESSRICFGMPVLSNGWLVGRIWQVDQDRSWVRLITDANYGVSAKVMRPESIAPGQLPAAPVRAVEDQPPGTLGVDGGGEPADIDGLDGESPASVPVETTIADTLPPDSLPADGTDVPNDTGGGSLPSAEAAPPVVEIRSTGLFQGRGGDLLPVIRFQDGLPSDQLPRVGDVVLTTGGELSLVPVDVPIGVVVSSERGTTHEGLLVEVEPQAKLDNLEFVQVMLYVPQQEAGQCASVAAS